MMRAAAGQGGGGVAEEGLQAGEDGVGADAGDIRAARGGEDADRADAHLRQERDGLILHDVGQGANEHEFALIG